MNKILTKKEMSAWVKATWEKCQKEAWGKSEMTRDDIIRMAQEAGGLDRLCEVHGFTDTLIYFAELVAAAERERCAKVCEETTIAWTEQAYNNGCTDCAQRIRSLRT